jgi:hypothetical protein
VERRDRLKDVIISGGENISTIEVEQAQSAHPGVAEAAVLGRPDEKWGEVPMAFVVASATPPPAEAELLDFVGEQLAGFKGRSGSSCWTTCRRPEPGRSRSSRCASARRPASRLAPLRPW